MLTVGSLFAGIGGFDRGFEQAGFKTVWQVELDEYCRKVLARHFPHAERFADIRDCGAHNLKPVDILCGGFPCQDISVNGKRAGITGKRSGLWGEMVRTIRLVRPRVTVVENVAALLVRGMGRVLGDLAEVGNDAEWDCLPAIAYGALHQRDRVFIISDSQCDGCSRNNGKDEHQCKRQKVGRREQFGWYGANGKVARPERHSTWTSSSEIPRVVDGIHSGLDKNRIAAIGNAIVPQVSEWIARRILEASNEPA